MERQITPFLKAKRLLCLVAAMIVCACAPLPHGGEAPLRYEGSLAPGKVVPQQTVQLKGTYLVQREPDEVSYHDEAPTDEAPKVCLALSGGGIRSAAFSVGVLAALDERQLLRKMYAISAVSGGGYALSWYYVQQYNAFRRQEGSASSGGGAVTTNLFDKNGKYISYLVEHSRFFTELDYSTSGVLNLPLAPVHVVTNGIFNWHANVGLPHAMYRSHIANLFFADPYDPNWDSSSIPSVYELGEFSRTHDLPVFVFNTTAWLGSDDSSTLTLHDSVFSFSPLMYGSDGYGMYRYPDDPLVHAKYRDLNKLPIDLIDSLSGAAMDFNSLMDDRTERFFSSILALNLGGYIDNPAVGPLQRLEHNALPLPIYFLSRFKNDLAGTGIYLTDGGHSENLGVYPLIKRGCQNIVVIDAEQDPYYEFAAYFLLKERLSEETKMTLEVGDIERQFGADQLSRLSGKSMPDLKEALSKHELLREGELSKLESDPSTGGRWIQVAKNPVMDGGQLRDAAGRYVASVAYVKLAYKPELDLSVRTENSNYDEFERTKYFNASPFPPECNCEDNDEIRNYYYCSKQARLQKPRVLFPKCLSPTSSYPGCTSDPFPQQPTIIQNFNDQQFRAYLALGKRIGKTLAEKLQTSHGI